MALVLFDGCEGKVLACEQDVENTISEADRENANATSISQKLSPPASSYSSGY